MLLEKTGKDDCVNQGNDNVVYAIFYSKHGPLLKIDIAWSRLLSSPAGREKSYGVWRYEVRGVTYMKAW